MRNPLWVKISVVIPSLVVIWLYSMSLAPVLQSQICLMHTMFIQLLGVVVQLHDEIETGLENYTIQWEKIACSRIMWIWCYLADFWIYNADQQEVAYKVWSSLQGSKAVLVVTEALKKWEWPLLLPLWDFLLPCTLWFLRQIFKKERQGYNGIQESKTWTRSTKPDCAIYILGEKYPDNFFNFTTGCHLM